MGKAIIIIVVLSLTILAISSTSFVKVASTEDFITRHLEWGYKGRRWTWNLRVPLSSLSRFKSVSAADRMRYCFVSHRYRGFFITALVGYSFFVTTEDPCMIEVARGLQEISRREGWESHDEVSFVLAFVQSLSYTRDDVSTGYIDYPRFPVETLLDGEGDCEDTSALFATMAKIMGYDVVLICPMRHVAVGVSGDEGFSGVYHLHEGKRYFYAETTEKGRRIGEVPSEYRGVATIVPIRLDDDGDGLSSYKELILKTSPLDADSDDDGLKDGQEVSFGTNPTVVDVWWPFLLRKTLNGKTK